jgi:hypothetical protein
MTTSATGAHGGPEERVADGLPEHAVPGQELPHVPETHELHDPARLDGVDAVVERPDRRVER